MSSSTSVFLYFLMGMCMRFLPTYKHGNVGYGNPVRVGPDGEVPPEVVGLLEPVPHSLAALPPAHVDLLPHLLVRVGPDLERRVVVKRSFQQGRKLYSLKDRLTTVNTVVISRNAIFETL